jgi:hypothetical protein
MENEEIRRSFQARSWTPRIEVRLVSRCASTRDQPAGLDWYQIRRPSMSAMGQFQTSAAFNQKSAQLLQADRLNSNLGRSRISAPPGRGCDIGVVRGPVAQLLVVPPAKARRNIATGSAVVVRFSRTAMTPLSAGRGMKRLLPTFAILSDEGWKLITPRPKTRTSAPSAAKGRKRAAVIPARMKP